MAEKVLLINHGAAFLSNALITSLRGAGVEAEQIGFEFSQLSPHEKDTDVFLYFAGNEDYTPNKLLIYLRDFCADEGRYLCVLGYSKDLAEVEEIVSKDAIKCEFLRPIDVKTFTEELCKLLRTEQKQPGKKSILLVDDDVAFLRIMQGWLSEKYSVASVKSGMQAITFIASHTPDLILLDYDMPVTPGPQVLQMIRSEPASANIPVIFLTGKDDRASVLSVMALKPDGYLLKTSGKENILSSVDSFLAKADAERGNCDP